MEELITLIRTLDESNLRDQKLLEYLKSLLKGYKENINMKNVKN